MENRQLASDINDLILRICGDLEGSLRETWEKASLEEQAGYCLSLNVVVSEIFENVLSPIYEQYPELDVYGIKNAETSEGATCMIPSSNAAPGARMLPNALSEWPIEDEKLASRIAALMLKTIDELGQSALAVSLDATLTEASAYARAVDAVTDRIRTHILTPLAAAHPVLERGKNDTRGKGSYE